MKKILALAAFTLIAALYFGSCDLLAEKYTPRERMEAFIEDANAGRWDDLKQHTHPEAEKYGQANSGFWVFLSNYIPLTNLSFSSGTTATFDGGGISFTATLAEDEEDNYKILDIYDENVSDYVFK